MFYFAYALNACFGYLMYYIFDIGKGRNDRDRDFDRRRDNRDRDHRRDMEQRDRRSPRNDRRNDRRGSGKVI